MCLALSVASNEDLQAEALEKNQIEPNDPIKQKKDEDLWD